MRLWRFSVSPSQLDSVLECVDKQQEHHCQRTFQQWTVSCFASTAWISTSATSGIEALDESRFQRFYAVCSNPQGDAPG